MTTFASLTPAQRAQVEYLFCDAAFNSDPAAYDYQLDGETVVARSALAKPGDAVHAKKPRTVSMQVITRDTPRAVVTVEMDRRAQMTLSAIAQSALERISTYQEA